MAFEGERRDNNKIYIVVAIFVILVIIFTVLLSSSKLISAIIEEDVLVDSWKEDINERGGESGLFGLEKWASFTYRNNNESYPAYITVTSFKTLFMLSEEELRTKTEDTIAGAQNANISIDLETKITGERALENGHKTMYIVYDGNDTSDGKTEKIKIIGETWNCDVSGTSVICIGFAQITDYINNNLGIDLTHWSKSISDKEGTFGIDYKSVSGLLFNVKCH